MPRAWRTRSASQTDAATVNRRTPSRSNRTPAPGAGVRFDRDGVLRFTVAASVWLAERVRHARGIGCGSTDPAAHGHVFEQAGTPDDRQTVLPVVRTESPRVMRFW